MRNEPDKIIVHHSADASRYPQASAVNDYHKKKFGVQSSLGYYTGYHYFIERDGTVMHARLETESGVHTIGHNENSVAICLAGNFNEQQPTAMQRNSLMRLCGAILGRHLIPATSIYAHRVLAAKPTDCYGTRLSVDWAREQYFEYANAGSEINMLWQIKEMYERILSVLSFLKGRGSPPNFL